MDMRGVWVVFVVWWEGVDGNMCGDLVVVVWWDGLFVDVDVVRNVLFGIWNGVLDEFFGEWLIGMVVGLRG